jgi:hypothetical protein
MAIYSVQCNGCGAVDAQYLPMPPKGGPPQFDRCVKCDGDVRRIYEPPGDHSENTHKAYWCESLSRDPSGAPVYVKSRAEEKRLCKEMGVARWEPGMNYRKEMNKRNKEAKDRAFESACRKAGL